MTYLVYITSSKNNLFISLIDSSGFIIYKDSGGMNCKRGSEKKTPKIAEKMLDKLLLKLNQILNDSEIVIKFRNHRYVEKGKITSQLRYLLKTWPNDIKIKGIFNDNKIVKTEVRYRSRRRV